MEFKLDDFDIKKMVERAIQDQLRDEFYKGYSPIKKRLEEGLIKAVDGLSSEIDFAVKSSIRSALLSPEFNKRLQDELIKACSDKFGGAMNAIMRAAAKRAATDAGFQKDVEGIVVAAAQSKKDP